jgi:hypothetical protein
VQDYIVRREAAIPPTNIYNKTHGASETIQLQRCLIRGRKAIFTRPDSHETGSQNPVGSALT